MRGKLYPEGNTFHHYCGTMPMSQTLTVTVHRHKNNNNKNRSLLKFVNKSDLNAFKQFT